MSTMDRYRKKERHADPTDGFLLSEARKRSDFDMKAWRALKGGKGGAMTQRQRTALFKFFGIPKATYLTHKMNQQDGGNR